MSSKFALIQRVDSAGFFSYVHSTFEYMQRAFDRGLIPVVDYRKGMDLYRTGSEPYNVWESYFIQRYRPEDVGPNPVCYRFPKLMEDATPYWPIRYFRYNFFDRDQIAFGRRFIREHIRVRPEVLRRLDELVARHHFRPECAIGVVYRGTDKATESPRVPYTRYDWLLRRLIPLVGTQRLYVQTDEAEFADFIRSRFDDVFVVPEFQTSYRGGTPVHVLNRKTGYEFGLDCMLMMLLIARCKCIVKNHTNLAEVACYFSEASYIFHVYPSQIETEHMNYPELHRLSGKKGSVLNWLYICTVWSVYRAIRRLLARLLPLSVKRLIIRRNRRGKP